MNWFDAFDSLTHYLFLALKLTVGLFIIVSNMNWTGRTKLSQMNAIDLVGNFILGEWWAASSTTATFPLRPTSSAC
ncbi:membrane protein [Bordetella trematum]|nr:membrane protein [Bordetella trematum]